MANHPPIRLRRYARLTIVALLAATLGARGSSGQKSDANAVQPVGDVTTIRVWGDSAMNGVIAALQKAFRTKHPGIGFETRLLGTGTGMAGLYTGVAEIAFMGRASTPKEIMAFEWVFRYKPEAITVMTGSLRGAGRSPALAVFVHKENPLSRISLAQLDGVFSCERRRGSREISTWGALGAGGEWTNRPIHAYTFDAETGSGRFFQSIVLNDSRKWAWQRVREFKAGQGSRDDASQQILRALEHDRYGIAVATLDGANPEIKTVALGMGPEGPYYLPTDQNLIDRTYPLTRTAFAYVNHPPTRPIARNVAEFLQFVVSPEGQQVVSRQGDFLPLPVHAAAEAVHNLE